MLVWNENTKVEDREKKAIIEALNEINYELDEENIQSWINDDTITLNTCRNGRDVIWILTENKEVCVYIDDLSFLNEKEIEEQLQ
jgi:hypothetical protein|nr:MAG TPA: hypothetical protein [Bacteriophage sp.]